MDVSFDWLESYLLISWKKKDMKTNIPRHPNEVTFVMPEHSRPVKPLMLILSVSLVSLARLKLGWIRNIRIYVLKNIL